MLRQVNIGNKLLARECIIPLSSSPFITALAVEAVIIRRGWGIEFDSDESYHIAYRDVALMMINSPTSKAIDRLTRTFIATYHGTEFETSLSGTITPELSDTPSFPPAYELPVKALRRELWDITGSTPPGWFGVGGERVTLASILSALRAGKDSEVQEWVDKVDLLNDASEAAGIWSAIKGTMVDLAEVAEGGGTLATLLIATMANTAMQGLAAGQMDSLLGKLDRLIESLDGGQSPRPDTNVIKELQATNAALE